MKTATETNKGLCFRQQLYTFVLSYIIKLTLGERKTLTKNSRNLSQQFPPTRARFEPDKIRSKKTSVKNHAQLEEKPVCAPCKLLSIVGTKTPIKSPTKTQISKRKSVTISEDPPEEIPVTSYEKDPLQDLGDTLTDAPQVVTKPVSRLLPPANPIIQMSPKRVLSSIPERDADERENRIENLRRKYRKALNPTSIEGMDVGDSEEVLDPQIRILSYHPHRHSRSK